MNSSTTLSTRNSEEISLRDLILKIKRLNGYLLSNWKLIMFFAFIGSLLGYSYAYLKKPIYIASTSFVVEEADKAGGGLLSQFSGLASLAGMEGNAGGMFQGDNLLELYKSRMMVQQALLSRVSYQNKGILLIDLYAKINELDDKWAQDVRLKGIRFDSRKIPLNRAQDSILAKAVQDINKNYLSVDKRDKKLSIIDVSVKSESEEFAKKFNDVIVKTVNNFYVETKAKKALQNFMILQRQTDSVRSVLNSAIDQSAAINDATPNLNPTRQILRAPVQRSQYNAEANKAILTQLIQNLELSKITLRKETPLLQVIDEPIYPLEKRRLSRIITAITTSVLAGFLIVLILIIKKIYLTITTE